MKMKIIAVLVLTVCSMVLTACRHTAHGVGQDIEHAGEKIQDKTQ